MCTKRTKKGVVFVEELPFSLIESEILPRVAGKSDIGRCRCVCKRWKSFLSSPTFGRMHLRLHGTTINDYKLLVFDGQQPFPFRTLSHPTPIPYDPNPIPNCYQHVFILASLDGLVCLASKDVPNKLVFWNPLTGAYRKVSFKPSDVFDFRYSISDVVGFYKDSSSSSSYKLLYLISGGGRYEAYVYSLRSDTVRKIGFDAGPATGATAWWSPATLWGHCMYFVTAYYTPRRCWWVMCFDVETETFRKICFPPPVMADDGTPLDYRGSLVVLDGCLHLCVSYTIFINRVCSTQCNLWRIDDDDRWVKVAAFCDPQDDDFTMQRICTASSGGWLAVLDEEKSCFKKMNTQDFTTHYRHFSPPSFGYTSSRMMYVETLVSPNPP